MSAASVPRISTKLVYKWRCDKFWAPPRHDSAGPVDARVGTCATLGEANEALVSAQRKLQRATADPDLGWETGYHADGRLYSSCFDSHTGYAYELGIVPHLEQIPEPPAIGEALLPHHLDILLQGVSDDGIMDRVIADTSARRVLLQTLLRDPERRGELIDKMLTPKAFETVCGTLLRFKSGIDEVLDKIFEPTHVGKDWVTEKHRRLEMCVDKLVYNESGREALINHMASSVDGHELLVDRVVGNDFSGKVIGALVHDDDGRQALVNRVCDPSENSDWSIQVVRSLARNELSRQALVHMVSQGHDLDDPQIGDRVQEELAERFFAKPSRWSYLLEDPLWRADVVKAAVSNEDFVEQLGREMVLQMGEQSREAVIEEYRNVWISEARENMRDEMGDECLAAFRREIKEEVRLEFAEEMKAAAKQTRLMRKRCESLSTIISLARKAKSYRRGSEVWVRSQAGPSRPTGATKSAKTRR